MDINDKVNNPAKTIARSILLIIWWVCIWGLTDFVIHHLSNKDPLRKVAFYVGLLTIIIGCVGLDPNMLNYM